MFFTTFEKSAQLWQINKADFMKFIPSLIKAELSEVYVSFPSDKPVDYDIKMQFIKDSYGSEFFHKRFRNTPVSSSKSFTEYSYKLTEMFDRWLQSVKATTK